MRIAFRVLILLCLLTGKAGARDIFVDNATGDDRHSGSHAGTQIDSGSQVRTIAKALRLARTGDRIILAKTGQPYRESVSLVGIRHSGIPPMFPLTIEGNGATLDGTSPIPDDDWTHYRDNIFRFHPKVLTRAALFSRGRAIQPLPLSPTIEVPPKLKPLQWCLVDGAIYFAVEATKLPPDYKLSYAELPTGITLYQVDHVVIRNLKIRGYRADGISAAVGARNVLLDNVTCTGNGHSGICVGGGAQVSIESCKLSGNAQAQLMTMADSETHILAGDFANDSARGWVDQGGRVYLGGKRVEGGLKAIKPEDAPKPPAEEKPSEKGKANDK
jgi:hypothetical protein